MLVMVSIVIISGWLGLQIPAPTPYHPVIAPLTALTFAMLLRWGGAAWLPLIASAMSVCAYWLAFGPTAPDSLASALIWILASTVAPGLGMLYHQQFKPQNSLVKTLDTRHLTAAAFVTAAASVALQSIGWLIHSGWQPQLGAHLILMGLLRDTVSCIIVAPIVLAWPTAPRTLAHKDCRPTLYTLLACIPIGALAHWAFADTSAPATTPWLGGVMMIGMVLWIAVRSLSAASVALLGILLVMLAPEISGQTHPLSAAASQDTHMAANWSINWAFLGGLTLLAWWAQAQTLKITAVHQHWQHTLEQTDIGIAHWTYPKDELQLSKQWWAMLGHNTLLPEPSGAQGWLRIHESDRGPLREFLLTLSTHKAQLAPLEFRMKSERRGWIWLHCHAALNLAPTNTGPTSITLVAKDVTLQRLEKEKKDLFETIFEHLHEALLITDGHFYAIDCNSRFTELLGCRRDDVIDHIPQLIKPLLAHDAPSALANELLTHGRWRGEIRARDRLGRSLVFQATASGTKDQDGLRLCAFVLSDITAQLQQKEQLERQACFDELTGLPNRVSLGSLLREALQASEREGFLLSICSFDVDHFKQLNSQLGHANADALLRCVAQRLVKTITIAPDQLPAVARLGGDEFALLVRSATLEESRRTIERVLRSVALPFELPGITQAVRLTGSIGATVYPIDSADADTLLRHADQAMYRAKQAGRNGYLYFDAELDRQKEARFEALARVQQALTDEQFVLYFQPKVNMRLGTVLGVEALLRWKHPRHGVIPPAQFLPLIEPTPLSEEVGNWVFDKGIDQLASWLRMGFNLSLSINVSARHLQSPTFKQKLINCLAPHPETVAHSLILEVLETAALADIEYTSQLMNECKKMGIRFALDDFGTGYSTLTYLKRLPLDLLKIDRSFVHNMLNDNQDMAIVQGVISLSQTFGCVVVAEGVESIEQAQVLVAAGCEIGQGNGIAKAMPGEEVPLWIKNYRGAVHLSSP